MKHLRTPAAVGLTGAATIALLTLTVAPAIAAPTTPPYAPEVDSNAVGVVSFYDSTGAPVVSGSSTAPFPMYSVGSATAHAGDSRAVVLVCLPQYGVDPTKWPCDQINAYTPYPVTSAPTVVANAKATDGSAAPVSTATASDLALNDITTEFPNTDTSTDGYAGLYQVRERTETANQSGNTPSVKYDDAYLMVDNTAQTFTVVYPAQTTTPPPSLPEAPFAIGLPLAGVVVVGGALALRRRRRAGANA